MDEEETKAGLFEENLSLRAQIARLQALYPQREQSQEPEHRYHHMVEHSLGLICTHDFAGNLLYVNPAAARTLGYTPQELIGANLRDFLVPAVRSLFDPYLARIRHQQTDQGFMQLLTKDGKECVWQYHNVRYEENGRSLYVIGCALDVTEQISLQRDLRQARDALRMQLQERTVALRESESRYRKLFENANDIIATFTLDGVITGANRSAEILSGWTRQEIIGQPYSGFTTPATVAAVENRIRQYRAGEKPKSNLEIELLRKDGSVALFEGRTRPIRSRDGMLIGFQAIFRDITERKRTEKLLRQAKEEAEIANRAKSEFLATMSHELRTPLNVMLGYADLLIEGIFSPLTAAQQDALRRIQKSTFALVDLVNHVLDLNRLEVGRLPVERRIVHIDQLFKEVEQETQGLRDLSGLGFHWQVERALPTLYTDPGKLKVVLKNLLTNAIKFTEVGDITLAAAESTDAIVLSVTDTGMGVPADRQALIFEAFQQGDQANVRGQKGVGLGLHIAKRLLDLIGGTIEVESEVGRGSTFRVRLPVER